MLATLPDTGSIVTFASMSEPVMQSQDHSSFPEHGGHEIFQTE